VGLGGRTTNTFGCSFQVKTILFDSRLPRMAFNKGCTTPRKRRKAEALKKLEQSKIAVSIIEHNYGFTGPK
jgi:hypothetical protein